MQCARNKNEIKGIGIGTSKRQNNEQGINRKQEQSPLRKNLQEFEFLFESVEFSKNPMPSSVVS